MTIASHYDANNTVRIPAKEPAAVKRLSSALPALVAHARNLYERALDAKDACEMAEFVRQGPRASEGELVALRSAEEEASARYLEVEDAAIEFPVKTIEDVAAKFDLLDLLDRTMMTDDFVAGYVAARLLVNLRDDVRALLGLPPIELPERLAKDEVTTQSAE